MSRLAVIGMNLVFLTVMPTLREEVAAHPAQLALGLVLSAVLSASWWMTGEWLRARRRDGAWLAIATLAVPVLELARGLRGLHVVSLLISILGIAAILTSWHELE